MVDFLFISSIGVILLLIELIVIYLVTFVFVGNLQRALQLIVFTLKTKYSRTRKSHINQIITYLVNEPQRKSNDNYQYYFTKSEIAEILHYNKFYGFFNLLFLLIKINNSCYDIKLNNLSDYIILINNVRPYIYHMWQYDVEPFLNVKYK